MCYTAGEWGTHRSAVRYAICQVCHDAKLFDNGLKLDISSYPHMNIRMGTKGKRPLRSLTPRDKIHAIQRIHDGESKASVARDIGVPESTLRGWCKNEDKLRFMSRQSATDNLCADALGDKMDGGGGGGGAGGGGLLGPPEKRQRLDGALPLYFSNKLKFDELAFMRSPLNGWNTVQPKLWPDPGSTGLPGTTRPLMAGSSLTHLSGLTGISQSPLAISFNELTTNLNLLAQLNPGLAAMSGLNSFPAGAGNLRTPKPSGQTPLQVQSPRSDSGDRSAQGLSVKNWAKQKPGEGQGSLNLSIKNEGKGGDIKSLSPSIAPSQMGGPMTLSNLAEDPLLYWLKSQQTMLGLNPLYPPTIPMGVTSPPIRSSTPQHMSQLAQTPPIPSAPLTPSSTPSGSLDEKNAAWYNWCKAFGASLHTLNPNAATLAALQANQLQQQVATTAAEGGSMGDPSNILYSHLTKETETPSVRSLSSNEQNPEADEATEPDLDGEVETEASGKPEDLSAAGKVMTPSQSPIAHSSGSRSPEPKAKTKTPETPNPTSECKKILDNMLFKMGGMDATGPLMPEQGSSESEGSFQDTSNPHTNNNDVSASNNNNNNNSNKTDEEEKAKYLDCTADEDIEAIRHGEKFLQWLENCSNPRVTAVQLMQLRFLIAAIKSGNETPMIEKSAWRSLPEDNEEHAAEEEGKPGPGVLDADADADAAEASTRCHVYAPAVYRSSATLLSSLFFPPYEFVHCDLDDDPDDCQITGEYQQYDELSSSS
ncbi:GM17814 [Drosophila sechellia]|uniref:GM17814 n=1 Tax=Drosophila sechellia TaxID=7238 RepID=B4IJH6_DROSE|nr:GM17814 [Drosophila sechellia]